MAEEKNEDSNHNYINELYKTLSYSDDQFDKNVLFIASGALGVSFAFVEKLVPNLAEAQRKCYLTDSWYVFSFVILVSLISHFVSSLSLKWSITHVNNKDKFEKGRSRWNIVIRCLNLVMIIGIFVGALLLVNFVQHNI